MKCINVFTLVSIFLLCSCTHSPVTSELNKAEKLLIDAPDSAERILNAIPRNELNGRAIKARFALLYSQAMDKCYIDTDSDSLISVAVKYYSKRGTNREKALAYYYESVVYRNANDVDAQVKSLIKAQQYVENTDDAYLKGLIYSKLGQLYYSQKQFEQAVDLFDKAVTEFDRVNSLSNKMRMLNNYGKSLSQIGKTNEAVEAKTEALNIANSLNDIQYATELEIDILNSSNNWSNEKLQSVKNNILKNKSRFAESEFYRFISNAYEIEGNIDSVQYYLTKYVENSKQYTISYCGCVARLSSLYEKDNNYKEALKYERSYSSIKNSVYIAERKNIVEDLERKYQTQLVKKSYTALRLRCFLYIVISILFVTILIVVLIYLNRRHKHKLAEQQLKYEAYIVQFETQQKQLQNQYDTLLRNIGAYKNANGEFECKLIEILEHRLTDLRKLSEFAYLYGENTPKKFYAKFQEHITVTNKNNSQFLDEILETANMLNCGLITYLEQTHPQLTKFDLSYCGLVSLGFTPESIRVLYNHTHIQSLYTIRFRIKSKIGFNYPSNNKISLEEYIIDLANKLKDNDLP